MTLRLPTVDRTPVDRWVSGRIPSDLIHLDAAACGRVSRAALHAEVDHLIAEAAHGGYVAEERHRRQRVRRKRPRPAAPRRPPGGGTSSGCRSTATAGSPTSHPTWTW